MKELVIGATDTEIVGAARSADITAIDSPFGWPRPWAEAVGVHRPGLPFQAEGPTALLTSRATDRWVAQYVGVRPLAVGANLIGATAIRCARILHAIGHPVDVGRPLPMPYVCEAYPAAALRGWGVSYQLYKGKELASARVAIVNELTAAGLPIALEGRVLRLITGSDDALDSVICSLVARAAAQGLTVDVPAELASQAHDEGWIRLPSKGSSLSLLR